MRLADMNITLGLIQAHRGELEAATASGFRSLAYERKSGPSLLIRAAGRLRRSAARGAARGPASARSLAKSADAIRRLLQFDGGTREQLTAVLVAHALARRGRAIGGSWLWRGDRRTLGVVDGGRGGGLAEAHTPRGWSRLDGAVRAGSVGASANASVRRRGRAYLLGLLSRAERANGWTLAESPGAPRRTGCSGCSLSRRGTRTGAGTLSGRHVVTHLRYSGAALAAQRHGLPKEGKRTPMLALPPLGRAGGPCSPRWLALAGGAVVGAVGVRTLGGWSEPAAEEGEAGGSESWARKARELVWWLVASGRGSGRGWWSARPVSSSAMSAWR